MSEILSQAESHNLLVLLQEKRGKQIGLMCAHEKSESFGMAYLALWAVIEDFATRLGPFCQRVQLKTELTSWLAYLDEVQLQVPPKISIGKFELAKVRSLKIPSDSQLQQVLPLEQAQQFYAVLATKSKFRDTRNAIAHSGENTSEKVYRVFKTAAISAIAEIEAWLQSGK